MKLSNVHKKSVAFLYSVAILVRNYEACRGGMSPSSISNRAAIR